MSALDKYKAALKAHDWFYMYADDYRSFDKGKDEWAAISAMQKSIDPDFIIFNEYAPPAMKVIIKTGEKA
ncbi:MAG: hypothetical protein RL442_47 [Pseudomonadota bacterium]|jgi:hypothetical protein